MVAQRVDTAECVANHTTMGRTTEPDKDAMEARFEIQAIKTKTNSVTRAETGEMTRKHPHAVATPFPPPRRPRYRG